MKKNIDSIRIEKMDNGFTVHKSYNSDYSTKGPSTYHEPDKTVHESVDSVLKEIKSCLSSPKSSKSKVKYIDKIIDEVTK